MMEYVEYMDITKIQIGRDTANQLKGLCVVGETYDSTIKKLLNYYKSKQEG